MNRQRPLQPKQEHHQCSQPILVTVVRVARTATKNPSDVMSSSSETPTSALTLAVVAPSVTCPTTTSGGCTKTLPTTLSGH